MDTSTYSQAVKGARHFLTGLPLSPAALLARPHHTHLPATALTGELSKHKHGGRKDVRFARLFLRASFSRPFLRASLCTPLFVRLFFRASFSRLFFARFFSHISVCAFLLARFFLRASFCAPLSARLFLRASFNSYECVTTFLTLFDPMLAGSAGKRARHQHLTLIPLPSGLYP
jgi:hypothetical protein